MRKGEFCLEYSGNLILENREKLSVSGVSDVESFDERRIVLRTGESRLVIDGSALKINSVSVEDGEAVVTGKIDGCAYTGGARGSFWGKITK